jgi:hypothetical protein
MRAERITSTSDNCYILPKQNPKYSSNKLKIEPGNCNHWFDSNPSYRLYRIDRRSISQIGKPRQNWLNCQRNQYPRYSYWPYYQRRNIAGPKYWNIWLTPFYSLKAIEITYRILRSLKKSIWFHSRNWHLRNVRKRFTWSFNLRRYWF